ncbi:MAG TPA: hypothetical protein PKA95_15175 [Thermomicrobiales bacterium]|nr:hypothetical protein [Thermomicrobiales bacterium]
MSDGAERDKLPEAVVAAIVALLARAVAEDEEEPEQSAWARSGRVQPDWRGEGKWKGKVRA